MKIGYRRLQGLTIFLIAWLICLGPHPYSHLEANPLEEPLFYVRRVIDGDTIELANGQRVRLIGIDTPEMHYSNKLLKDARRSQKDIRTIQEMGVRSWHFTRSLCQGKSVRLEFDVEKRDRYGRLLAYVYLEDGTFLNAKILEEGYGQILTVPPNVKYAEHFLKLQEDARLKGKGLWQEEQAP